jgi:hypothetical protein
LNRQLAASVRGGGSETSHGLDVVWRSTDPAVAVVKHGEVSGVAPGEAGIVATTWAGADTALVTVAAQRPDLAAVTVSPAGTLLGVGSELQFSAIARYRDSSSGSVTDRSRWTSSAPRVAMVQDGRVTGVMPGQAVIVATFEGYADSSSVTVESPPPSSGVAYPLMVGSDGHHLTDQRGRPFLMIGDAAWSLVAQLPLEDAEAYLAGRQVLGFNTVLVSLLEHKYAANAPANASGASPFTGRAFTTPNETYFAHADSLIGLAAARDMLVLLAPLYLGNGCRDQGWCAEVQAASAAVLTAWGRYIGDRYGNDPNIIWVIGGDTDPTPVRSKVLAFVSGLRSADSTHLMTAHNGPEQMAVQPWRGERWVGVNNVYSYSASLYEGGLAAYGIRPAVPYFLVESAYENDPGVTPQQLRAQSYWTLLAGGMGHVFGNCPMWHFGGAPPGRWCSRSDWREALSSDGSFDMRRFGSLFSARHWHLLVPDTARRALTEGRGRSGQADHALAAYASDSSSIIAYLPTTRTVTVSGAVLAGGTMTAWWFAPGTGRTTPIGVFPTATSQRFTPPSEGDWVLVVDSERFGFPPPGSLTPGAQP